MESKERMETPNKAQYRDADASKASSSMGGKDNWTPVFEMGATGTAAGTMDFVTLMNLAVTSREMRKICKGEVLSRRECEAEHVENCGTFFVTK